MAEEKFTLPDTVSFDKEKNALVIIDQSQLPNKTELLYLNTIEQVHRAIYLLKVRGAPAIGVAAAYGLYLAALAIETEEREEFVKKLNEAREYLAGARPTAVNLSWAVNRTFEVVKQNPTLGVDELKERLYQEAVNIHNEDIAMCRQIGEYGLSLLKDGQGILTHCNAGWLATSKYGTALAPIHLGKERGMNFQVYADETRPLLQGGRLTAYELAKHGIDVTVICDNMASQVMQKGWVQAVLVGADRIAANGDTANKIGTNGVAILAKYYGIPFYVLAPYSTIDLNCPCGSQIKIEQRPAGEVREMWYRESMITEEAKIFNPAFDVTANELITAIVTDKGIISPPFQDGIAALLKGDE